MERSSLLGSEWGWIGSGNNRVVEAKAVNVPWARNAIEFIEGTLEGKHTSFHMDAE
jgi:hypothetical protein